MRNIKIYPYKIQSESAKTLRDALRVGATIPFNEYTVWLIKSESELARERTSIVVNWGNSNSPNNWEWTSRDLNNPSAVARATNKLASFRALEHNGISVPDWTDDYEVARDWIDNGKTVVIRHFLNSHSGRGIQILDNDTYLDSGEDLPDAPLYVLYKKKRSEYRIHVFNNTVIDIQEKRRERAFDRNDVQAKVRSRANGWVFCRDNINVSDSAFDLAKQAVQVLDLDFGAVDIIYNEREDMYYVLEVNTAVGLEGSTVSIYANAIKGYVERLV